MLFKWWIVTLRILINNWSCSTRLLGGWARYANLLGDEAVLDNLTNVFSFWVLSILIYSIVFELTVIFPWSTVCKTCIWHYWTCNRTAQIWIWTMGSCRPQLSFLHLQSWLQRPTLLQYSILLILRIVLFLQKRVYPRLVVTVLKSLHFWISIWVISVVAMQGLRFWQDLKVILVGRLSGLHLQLVLRWDIILIAFSTAQRILLLLVLGIAAIVLPTDIQTTLKSTKLILLVSYSICTASTCCVTRTWIF